MQYHQIMHKKAFYIYKDKSQGSFRASGRNTAGEVQALFMSQVGHGGDISERGDNWPYELFKQCGDNNPAIFVGQYPVDEWHNRPGGGFHHGQNHP